MKIFNLFFPRTFCKDEDLLLLTNMSLDLQSFILCAVNTFVWFLYSFRQYFMN